MTGTSVSSAIFAARYLLAPQMISASEGVPFVRTMRGSKTPCSLMLSESSLSAFASKYFRGFVGDSRRAARGITVGTVDGRGTGLSLDIRFSFRSFVIGKVRV